MSSTKSKTTHKKGKSSSGVSAAHEAVSEVKHSSLDLTQLEGSSAAAVKTAPVRPRKSGGSKKNVHHAPSGAHAEKAHKKSAHRGIFDELAYMIGSFFGLLKKIGKIPQIRLKKA
jgi:hypothetical protein